MLKIIIEPKVHTKYHLTLLEKLILKESNNKNEAS
jgi:hypothetical protein